MVMGWFYVAQNEGCVEAADELLFEELVRSGIVEEKKSCSCCDTGCCSDPDHCCQLHTCEDAEWKNGKRIEFDTDEVDVVEQFCCPSCQRLS